MQLTLLKQLSTFCSAGTDPGIKRGVFTTTVPKSNFEIMNIQGQIQESKEGFLPHPFL